MDAELETLVRKIISDNNERRAEWSSTLGEIAAALASDAEDTNERLEEILDGLTATGDDSGQDG